MQNILVTGGSGYIGSHTCVELLNAGYSVTVVDNLINSSEESIKRIKQITGKSLKFYRFSLQDKNELEMIFARKKFEAVLHFAGLKAVGESVKKPLIYYRNNIDATLTLLETMQKFSVNKIVFSSSATVYGSAAIPYTEDSQTGVGITNAYGQTKNVIEQILKDYSTANPDLEASILRYFNPIGAHPSGLIGEDPSGVPNNLMPFIEQVASGRRYKLSIFGNDYPTTDGTCRRDYIHVVDLAQGHVAALKHIKSGLNTYNLGSGTPTSVLELVDTFIKEIGCNIPIEFAPRRAGDLPEFWANTEKATKELNWKTRLSIADACKDSWNWQSKNPRGYSDRKNK